MASFLAFDLFHMLFGFLPVWFEVFIGLCITMIMIFALLRVVAFIMDVIPFI